MMYLHGMVKGLSSHLADSSAEFSEPPGMYKTL